MDIDRVLQHEYLTAASHCMVAHRAEPYREGQEGAYQLRRALDLLQEAIAMEEGHGAARAGEDFDASVMEVGDRVRMPHHRWGSANRKMLAAAHAHDKQFIVTGNDEGSGYWMERTR